MKLILCFYSGGKGKSLRYRKRGGFYIPIVTL